MLTNLGPRDKQWNNNVKKTAITTKSVAVRITCKVSSLLGIPLQNLHVDFYRIDWEFQDKLKVKEKAEYLPIYWTLNT